jgi:hypothetical protein
MLQLATGDKLNGLLAVLQFTTTQRLLLIRLVVTPIQKRNGNHRNHNHTSASPSCRRQRAEEAKI